MKLNKKQILNFKTHKNLVDYFTKLPDKIFVNATVLYRFSGGHEKWLSASFSINKDVANNKELYNLIVLDHFNNYENIDGDHGHGSVIAIAPPMFPRTRGVGVKDILMRFNENNDCVFRELYNGIKNFIGYKRYSVDKIKDEFKYIGIDYFQMEYY